ncbi:hypothetical protein AAP_02458 [Ascosphaera apis ARSEF 7405]|uniref:Uncharacterized protein n=1 Tax=Ascosphaera apis ARSEF 7405 TaxID=392613 RepID=A0A168AA18_9EURO|nr:hypothetical protein AAP_02458 [Ascosphaera apis ARSEF 7405]
MKSDYIDINQGKITISSDVWYFLTELAAAAVKKTSSIGKNSSKKGNLKRITEAVLSAFTSVDSAKGGLESERVTPSSIVATTIVSASLVPVVVGGWKSLNLPVSVPPLPTIDVRGEADLSSDREDLVCSRSTLSSHPSSFFALAAPPFLPHPNIFYLALSENGKEISTRSHHFVTELAHKAVVMES